MKFLHIDLERKGEVVEATPEDYFHSYVSVRLGLVGVKINALVRRNDLEDATIQMLNFAQQVAEDLAAKGEVRGDLVYDWDENRYSSMNLESKSGLPSELPSPRLPLKEK